MSTDYTRFNALMWDKWSKRGKRYTLPLSHEAYLQAGNEPLRLYLTPEKPLPDAWFCGVGKRVLALAAGGGQQGPLLQAHGYDVTVMDLSHQQLLADRLVAAREGYALDTICADMSAPFPFGTGSFDWIVLPVATCYIEELDLLWAECFRVLKPGGVLMAAWTNPLIYMFKDEALSDESLLLTLEFPLPYNGRLELERGRIALDADTGYQFSHSWEAHLGGQLRAGFLLKDFFEDTDRRARLSAYSSLYAASLALKPRP